MDVEKKKEQDEAEKMSTRSWDPKEICGVLCNGTNRYWKINERFGLARGFKDSEFRWNLKKKFEYLRLFCLKLNAVD